MLTVATAGLSANWKPWQEGLNSAGTCLLFFT